jgi:hypothetical protein
VVETELMLEAEVQLLAQSLESRKTIAHYHNLDGNIIQLHFLEVIRMGASDRPVKIVEQYTAECHRLNRGSDITQSELHVLEKFMPLEGQRWQRRMHSICHRRSISNFLSWFAAVVAPIKWRVGGCFREKRPFLWHHRLGKRHGYIDRRRGKRGQRDIPFVKISGRSGTSMLSSLLSRTRWYILQRSDRPSLHLMLGRHGEYIS